MFLLSLWLFSTVLLLLLLLFLVLSMVARARHQPQICWIDYPRHELIAMDCGHYMCRACWTTLVKRKVDAATGFMENEQPHCQAKGIRGARKTERVKVRQRQRGAYNCYLFSVSPPYTPPPCPVLLCLPPRLILFILFLLRFLLLFPEMFPPPPCFSSCSSSLSSCSCSFVLWLLPMCVGRLQAADPATFFQDVSTR